MTTEKKQIRIRFILLRNPRNLHIKFTVAIKLEMAKSWQGKRGHQKNSDV
jgi:hypothetical protein